MQYKSETMNKNKQYTENLNTKEWREKKRFILKRDNYTCTECKSKSTLLHVHHKIYIENRLPWQYEDKHLTTLCETCHSWLHGNQTVKVLNEKKNKILHKEQSKKDIDLIKMQNMLSENDKKLNKKYNKLDLLPQTKALPDLYVPKNKEISEKLKKRMEKKRQLPKKKIIRYQVFRGMLKTLKNS